MSRETQRLARFAGNLLGLADTSMCLPLTGLRKNLLQADFSLALYPTYVEHDNKDTSADDYSDSTAS